MIPNWWVSGPIPMNKSWSCKPARERSWRGSIGASDLVQPMTLGSQLKLGGVYAGKGGDRTEGRDVESFELLLNSPSDVAVLRRPSWWTPQRALAMCGALVGGLLMAAAWIGGLRRQVKLRTLQLEAEIDEHKRAETRLAGEIEERKRIEKEVERIHRELVDASRQAGQAEVASSVLHNVGNVLNSVNVSAGLIVDQVRSSKAAPAMDKLTELLVGHRKDLPGFLAQDGRGENVVQYLQGITQQLGSERSNLLGELTGITKNIDHIKEIVAMQQSYAQISGVMELQSLSALLEDALRMHATSLTRHKVRIIREFDPIPDIFVDKHKVLQILVNLITNAKWAWMVPPRPSGCLRWESTSIGNHGQGVCRRHRRRDQCQRPQARFHSRVHDAAGRSRLWLHSGILAAKEMGGTLRWRAKDRARVPRSPSNFHISPRSRRHEPPAPPAKFPPVDRGR